MMGGEGKMRRRVDGLRDGGGIDVSTLRHVDGRSDGEGRRRSVDVCGRDEVSTSRCLDVSTCRRVDVCGVKYIHLILRYSRFWEHLLGGRPCPPQKRYESHMKIKRNPKYFQI